MTERMVMPVIKNINWSWLSVIIRFPQSIVDLLLKKAE